MNFCFPALLKAFGITPKNILIFIGLSSFLFFIYSSYVNGHYDEWYGNKKIVVAQSIDNNHYIPIEKIQNYAPTQFHIFCKSYATFYAVLFLSIFFIVLLWASYYMSRDLYEWLRKRYYRFKKECPKHG